MHPAVGMRILVVDDDIDTALMMKLVLESAGHDVVALTCPKIAVERATREAFDAVITDLAMEELDGLSLCSRVVIAQPETPVIVITGQGTIQRAIDAMRAGAYDFILKPVDQEQLTAVVAEATRKRGLRAEVRRLQRTENASTSPLGSSDAMRHVHELVDRIAASEASVLVQGETGTGKELVARALHDASGVKGPFVALNCAAVPFNLLESELFGHARGAFTDAHTQRSGLFREADDGTIFLDEIGDLPLEIQPKLLRALQERTVRPVGSNAELPFKARLVAATNRDLEAEVRAKRFRADLFYRINVINVQIPALRDRGTDVIVLASQFLARAARRSGRKPLAISYDAAQRLLQYSWPGNVRELENCIERAAVLARSDAITVSDLPEKVTAYVGHRLPVSATANDTSDIITINELERRYVVRVIGLLGGNKARAAQMLGLDRKTLYRKLARWGVALGELRPTKNKVPVAP